MDFHGIDTKGKIWIERLTTKPANSSENDGRLILAGDTKMLSFGTDGVWIDIGDENGIDVTSNPDPQIATNTGDISDNASDITDINNNVPIWQAGVIPGGPTSIFLIDSATVLVGWSLVGGNYDTVLYIDSAANNGVKAGSTWTQPSHIHATRSHAITTSEMPVHTHPPASGVANFMSSTGSSHGRGGDSYGVYARTGGEGGNQPHNHGNVYDNGTVSTWRPSGYNVARQVKLPY